jgi:hypothetical protein
MEQSRFPTKIMLINDFGEEIIYRVACDCGNPVDDVWIDIEYDKSINYVTLSFMTKTHYTYLPWDSTFMEKVRYYGRRTLDAIILLFGGRIELESTFMMKDKEHIDNFSAAINEGHNLILERHNIPQGKVVS